MNAPLRLYTFSVSHFSEKIRWMLDVSAIRYTEVRWTPFLHMASAWLKSRKATSVPILQSSDETIQDSTRILLWLERHYPQFQLLAQDPEQRKEILEIEDRFDRIGPHVIRYVYSVALDDEEGVKRLWTLDSNPLQRALVQSGFPVMRIGFTRLLAMTPNNVEKSRSRIDADLSWLEERLAGKQFLVGNRLSAADITAAALLGPLVCPSEHPVYGRQDYRDTLRPLIEPWRSRPAFVWVESLYREHRKPRKKP